MKAETNPGQWPSRIAAMLAAELFVAWCALMWPQWEAEPNLTHGLFMPIVFCALVYEGARSGSTRFLPDNLGTDLLQCGAALLGLLAAAAGGFYGDTMGWDHALADFFISAGLALLLLSVLMALSRDGSRILPFAWPCVAAILLCVLCAPLPPGTSARFTSLLQLGVTECVLRSMNALGIPGFRTGNVIELAHARVGVEEACSGLRSLVSCIFAGIFISAAWVRGTIPRVAIILLAAPIAIAMNLFRSLLLALAAENGIRIGGLLHDVAGIAILVVTTLTLVVLGAVLSRGGDARPPGRPLPRPVRRSAPGWLALGALLGAMVLVGTWALKPTEMASPSGALPDLAAIVPESVPGWSVSTARDIKKYGPELHTGCLFQRTYTRVAPGVRQEVTIYVAYWRPGQASVTLVSSHTPDMCWPGLGWAPVPEMTGEVNLRVDRRELPPAQQRLFLVPRQRLNVWYWHLYEGRVVEDFDTHSPTRLLSEVVANGVRSNRSQIFVRITANARWSEIGDGLLLATFFRGLRGWGF